MNRRRYTFKLYPTPHQEMEMDFQCRMVARLWNAMLEMQEDRYRKVCGRAGIVNRGDGEFRKEHWRPKNKSFYSEFDLGYQVTMLLASDREWRTLSTWTPRAVAKKLVAAMEAFFKRAMAGAGASAGYPRYKSTRRADWIPHRFASGCKLTRDGKSWRLYLKGIEGLIHVRGEFPSDPLKLTDADIRWDRATGDWWLSVATEMDARLLAGKKPVRVVLDGIDCFARVNGASVFAHQLGIETDQRIERLSQQMAEHKGAQQWQEYREARRAKSRIQAKASRRRKEFLHVWTTGIVRQSSEIELTRPRTIKESTKSGRGDEKEWGAATEAKAEFNRAILAQAPATVAAMLRYKAEEAGVPLHEIASEHLDVGNNVVTLAKAARRVRRQLKQVKKAA